MILRIDHLAVSSNNFSDDIKFWEDLGYTLEFIENNLKNLENKKNFLTSYQENHDLALLTNPENFSIELLNHGIINENKSQIMFPVFQNLTEDLIRDQNKLINFINFKLREIIFNQYKIFGYILKEEINQVIKFNKLMIKVKNLQESIKFWNHLGFKTQSKESEHVVLKYQSILSPAEYFLFLYHFDSPSKESYYLNDKGFNCIALISNSAENEKDLLDCNNIFTTKIMQLEVNRVIYNIFFANGPSNEIVEIIAPLQK